VSQTCRTNFCEGFNALVNPVGAARRNEWRLALAPDLLATGGARAGEIRFSIGYGSEGRPQRRV
jgi:hypothetical protein